MSAEVFAFAGLVLGLVVAAVVALAVWIVRAVRHELRLWRARRAMLLRLEELETAWRERSTRERGADA